jgi:predicted RNA-binding protein (virulence factor B family)
MIMEAGKSLELIVIRDASPHGYILTNGKQEVLLPHADIERKLEINQKIQVFLYHDTLDRLIATSKTPLITWNQVALLQAVDVHPRFGYFLEMGLPRQVLLPFKFVPELRELRPQLEDQVYVYLDHDRQGRLIAKPAREEQLVPMCVRAPIDWKNRTVEGIVYQSLQMGTFVVCEAGVLGFGVIGFIPASERIRMTRLGERLQVRVTFVREDGRVNLSMRPRKEESLDLDAQRILDVLFDRPQHAMPYSDLTPHDVIQQKFGLSKAAFKRALGKLMKEGKVVQNENWTRLNPTFIQNQELREHKE